MCTVSRGGTQVATLTSYADSPALSTAPDWSAPARGPRTAVVLPHDDVRPDGPLPVLMAPYGGPHFRMVGPRRRLSGRPSGWPTRDSLS